MKKVTALFLCVLTLMLLCACKDKGGNDSKVDIEKYASLGQIPESEFILGDTPDTIKTVLEKKQEEAGEEEDYYFDVIEGENNVLITDGTYEYYYKKAAQEKGIVYMVSYTDAYGFKPGDVILQVKDAIEGTDYREEPVTKENAFFYMGDTSGSTAIILDFERYTVMFIFEDNALSATVIYDRENWSN